MNAIRFHAVIGSDQIIRPPEGVELTPGEVEVIVLQQKAQADGKPPRTQPPREHLIDRLARLAEELGVDTSDLPKDLAENHDHYLHGLPKGIDNQ